MGNFRNLRSWFWLACVALAFAIVAYGWDAFVRERDACEAQGGQFIAPAPSPASPATPHKCQPR